MKLTKEEIMAISAGASAIRDCMTRARFPVECYTCLDGEYKSIKADRAYELLHEIIRKAEQDV